MSLDNLQNLFENELKDIYNAEKQLVDALPSIAKAASSPELSKAITSHLGKQRAMYSAWSRSCAGSTCLIGARSARVWRGYWRKARRS